MNPDPNKKKNLLPKGPQKPNYQVWIMVFLIALIFGITYLNKSTSTVLITAKRFHEMMVNGDVRDVVLINEKFVEVTLRAKALEDPKYKGELEDRHPFSLSRPHYRFNITTAEIFDKKFEEVNSQLPGEQQIGYQVEERSDFTSIIFQWGFLFLILFGFWFLYDRYWSLNRS